MNKPPDDHSLDIQLSAYLDGELDTVASRQVVDHLAACTDCAARLVALQTLTADFASLPQVSLGFDLAGVIEGQLAATTPARPRPRTARWRDLLPVTVGAAASITLGIVIGAALFGGGAAVVPRMMAMKVFDTIPPGSLCPGSESCYATMEGRVGRARK